MAEFSAIVGALKEKFGDAVIASSTYRDQDVVTVDKGSILDLCTFLRDEPRFAFDMLTDLTAVDFMGRETRFQVVYNLYSFGLNQRLRLKADIGEGDSLSTVEGVWKAANWLEREVYDLFGIVFDNHSDLRRILLWDGYIGHPLRKDFPLTGVPQKAVYR